MKITHSRTLLAPLLIVLLWLNPLIYFLKFNQIAFWHTDTMLLWGAVLATIAVSAAVAYWGNWICRIIIITLSVGLTLSFMPNLSHMIWIKIISLIVLIGLLWLTDNTITVLTYIAGALVLSSLLLSVGKQLVGVKDQISTKAPKPGNHPLVLQIVLDEHIGANGIPTDFPQGKVMQQFIKHFYLSHGFTLYANAYSRYPRTYDSIPNMLNFTASPQHTAYFPGGIHELTLDKAKAFNIAQSKGYQIRVFQAYYINYCRANGITFGRCYTYGTKDLQQINDMPISLWAKNNFILKSFLLNSSWYQAWLDWYANSVRPFAVDHGINLPFWPWSLNQLSSPSAIKVFAPLTQDIEQHPRGVYIFAHVLFPHSPYVFTSDCHVVKSPDNWYTNYDEGPVGNSPERRRLRYHYYLQQMRCAYQPLGHMLTMLDKEGLLSDAYIVVQGDHGSRIAEHGVVMSNEANVTWQDFTDSYAALFAERTPHSKPGIIEDRLPITYLYGQWFSEAMGQAIPHDDTAPYVYLTVRDTSQRIDMTHFSLNQFKNAPADANVVPTAAQATPELNTTKP